MSETPPVGFEPTMNSSKNSMFLEPGGAKCGAVDSVGTFFDDGLDEITEAWPHLSQHVQDQILDMVRAGTIHSKSRP